MEGDFVEIPFFLLMEQEKVYGLIGKSLKHFFSKKYFSDKFDKENIKATYLNFELNQF